MNQSPTIHVPSKRTDEVDWANPLKRYIQTTYQEDPEKYADEANSIHRLRQDMRGAGKDITGRDLLYRYYGQLELLDLRFPVDENHIRVSFTWYDAFTHKATSQFSLAYEKASTIFNIASILSAIATSQNRFEPEGLKRASNFFQASAGMYTYINDNFLHAPSTDLSRDTVKLLSQLMLAQAQECFLEQSIGLKKTPAFIAKLAAQAGWIYGNIVENMSDLISRNVFDRSWLTVCQIKQKYFASIAQYQKSLACEGSSKYGECVGRLNVAESLAKEANKLSNNFISAFSPAVTPTLPPDAAVSLQDLTKSNLALITEKKNSATRDNDIVYHEVVPQESVIPPIDKLSAVKQISIQDLYGANEIQKVIGQDIFQRLIPLSVHESASLYSEEKAKMVRSETERCDVSNGELEAALEYMKLPGALVKFKTISNNESRYLNELASPTSEVKQWSQLIKTEEEQKGTINDLQMTLNSLKSRAKEVLDDISLILENEQRDYDGTKAKYGDLAPKTLTTAFRQDFLNHIDALEKAATSDQHLFQRYNQSLNDIMILRRGENSDDLEKIFAEALASSVNTNNDTFVGGRRVSNAESLLDVDTSNSGEDISIKLHKIEECISNLNKVRKERMDTLNDLKEKTHQDDISHLLILNKKSQNIEPQLFATELEKFSPYRNRITASVHHQQALLQELTANFKSLMESDEAKTLQTRWDHAERRRKDVCDRLRKAKDSYFEVKEGLRNGIQFYVDLTELIEKLSKNLHQNVKSCQQDRNELVQSLQAQEQQRVKDQINHLISPNTPSSNQVINYSSIAQLTEKTNKLSINNNVPINNRDLDTSGLAIIPQTQSSFYSATSQPYVPSTQSPVRKDSYPNASAPYAGPIAPPKPSAPPTLAGLGSLPNSQSPVRKDSYSNASAPYASPIAPPKPSAPPTLAGLGSPNNYSQRSTSFSAQPSSIYMIKPSSPTTQGPPVPPLPTGYQQQQNFVYNSYQPRQSDTQRLYQPASVSQSQQQSSILHQTHSFTGQYTQPPQPQPQASQVHTSQQHGSSTPLPPSQQSYSGSSAFVVQTPSQSMQPSYPSTNIQYSQQPQPPPQPPTSSTPLPPPPQPYHQSSCDNYVPSQTGYSQVPPTNQFLQSHYTAGNQYQQLQPPQQYSGTQTQISLGFNNNPQVLPSQQQIYYRPQSQVTPGQQSSGSYMQHSQGNYQTAPSQPSQLIHQGYSYHQQTHPPPAPQQQKSLLD